MSRLKSNILWRLFFWPIITIRDSADENDNEEKTYLNVTSIEIDNRILRIGGIIGRSFAGCLITLIWWGFLVFPIIYVVMFLMFLIFN